MEEFGDLLRVLRMAPGMGHAKPRHGKLPEGCLSREELANAAGIDVNTLKSLEAGKPIKAHTKREAGGFADDLSRDIDPASSVIERIARALSLSHLEADELGRAYLLLSRGERRTWALEPHQKALANAKQSLDNAIQPGFALDEAAMVVMINQPLIKLEQLAGVSLDTVFRTSSKETDDTIKHNIMRWEIDKEWEPMHGSHRPSYGDSSAGILGSDELLGHMIRQFRVVSLKYRHTARLIRTLRYFWGIPKFRSAWNRVSQANRAGTEQDGPIDNIRVTMDLSAFSGASGGLPGLDGKSIVIQTKVDQHETDRGLLRVYSLEPMNEVARFIYPLLLQQIENDIAVRTGEAKEQSGSVTLVKWPVEGWRGTISVAGHP